MILAALDAGDVTLAAGILGLFWLVVQFFDRIYGSKKKETATEETRRVSLEQSSACGIQHSQIAAQMARAHELLNEQTKAQLELTRAVSSLVASTERQAMAADYRHRELLAAVKEERS